MPLITRTKKMYSINFRPRLNKAKNQSTIYIRLSINGKICSDIATPIKIAPDKWNVEKKTIKGIDKLSLVQNQELLSIKSEIIALILANPFFDVDEIKELYIGNKKKDMLVVEALEEYLTEKVFSAPESKKSKVLIYKYILKKIKHCIGNEEVYISEITQKKLDALYLKVLDGIGLNYAKLTINTLIRAIKYCSKKIAVKIHDLSTSEYKKTPKKVKTFMLDADYLLFKNEKTTTPKQEIAKDLALVMARTGVDYCDLQGIFEKAKENTKVISLPRTKTNVMASIPLLDETLKIIEKYNFKLPKIPLSTINKMLLKFEKNNQLQYHLSTKILRKTAGMYYLERKIPIQIVSKILGHKKVSTTQDFYVDITNKLVLSELLEANIFSA